PAEPNIQVHSNYGYFENKVVIESVSLTPGSFDTFSAYLSPTPTNTSYVNITNAAFNSTEFELTNLDGATEYSLTVRIEKPFGVCGLTEADSFYQSVTVCTAPYPPDLNNRAYGYDVSRIRVWVRPSDQLKTVPIGKIDQYKLMGVTNTTSGDPVPFTTTPVNPASVSSYMLINLPEAGTSYELSFASIITSHCGGVSIYSERWTNITRCTVPSGPYIDWNNRRTVAVADQTALTFRGSQIRSSDTYGINYLFYYPSFSPITRFSENPPFANSASSDLTIGNLTAGNGYRLRLVSAIGTSSPCGRQLVSSATFWINICTDPPDIEAVLYQRNATSFKLNSIIPNSGWDFFSVEATPQLPQIFVNRPSSFLPISITDLIPGTQYTFNVSVTISIDCDYGTNHPSWDVVIACT
ncbi:uncharacterized protein LOC142357435, partial [Convolutriloba macropyga]|uniref:uncharacterized protein LOC142357435 n=1 Tax=Convolutriloba macropyga TaxID=536237 RepID=UPI003F528CFC